ncbi:MAG: hypothetical protein WD492_12690 [Alkalispirochaeta sp.]
MSQEQSVQVVVVPASDLHEIREEIGALREELARIKSPTQKRWYTLHEAADVKGISFDVLRKLPRRYWPNFGRSTSMIDGSRKYKEVYRDTDVMAWMEMTEADIDHAYREMLLSKEVS